ncbi:MAG TPA: hypothetical protein VMW52_10405, partial [Phycisphaerae bacterium]|nr:hypothetical protein [Phycisphaerae bacterium]
LASVPGALTGTFSGRVELRANAAGTALDGFCDLLLQICMSAVATLVYSPDSSIDSQQTATIHYWQDGKRKGLAGAHGTCKITAQAGGIVYIEFELKGKWIAPEDEATPEPTFNTALPFAARSCTLTVQDAFEAVVGTFTFDLGVTAAARLDATDATGVLAFCGTGRAPTLTIDPEATTVAAHDWDGIRLLATEAAIALAMTDGTVTLTLAAAQAQYRSVADGDREGILTHEVVIQLNETETGDDDWTLTASV